MKRMIQLSPYLYALAAIFLWSLLAVSSIILSHIPPFLLIGIAFLFGSICGTPFIKQWKASYKIILLGVYGIFGYHFCLFMALRAAPAIESNLLNYLWPLGIVLLTPIFLKNTLLKKHHIAAAFLGFIGAALIVTNGKFNFNTFHIGYAYAIAAAFIWSTYSLLSKRLSISTPVIGLFCFISGVLSLFLHFILEPSYSIQLSELLLIIVLGIGPMGASFYFWNTSMNLGDSRIIGSISYLTPLLSTTFLALYGKAQITFISILAMFLIVLGAIVGTKK
ncbi:MAG: DMT family transporter [Oligoflexia bacterium]|nr:DMT family transporter [Oligoflexia bacterium]